MSAFAESIGINLQNMKGFGGDRQWSEIKNGLVLLLNHSDCDGELHCFECGIIEPALRAAVKGWPDNDYDKQMGLRLADAMEHCARTQDRLIFA